MVRLTTDESLDVDPTWTPDGRRVAFRSARSGVDNIFWQRADGTEGEAQRLTDSNVGRFPLSWHPSGKFLAYREFGQQTRSDIWILPMDGDEASGWKPGKPTIFAGTRFDEGEAMFSPDGRWIAYQSNESGGDEIYVSAFPVSGARIKVSADGGLSPIWSRATKELFFRNPENQIMVAGYSIEGNVFHADKPRLVSEVAVTSFDVHPDGQRLAVLMAPPVAPSSTAGRLVFVFNFFDEIRRLGQQAGR